VQVSNHDGHPAEVIGVAQQVVMRRALLVGALDGGLQRRVAGLDQVPGQLGIGGQAVGDRDDHRVPAGAESQVERGGIQQDPVPGLRRAGEARVAQRPQGQAVNVDVEFGRTGPLAARANHRAVPPCDHDRQVNLCCMSKRKTERLLGLVVCLLATSRYLTAEQIRDAVPGYPENEDLFKRMFERDKEDLRDLGVPLETGLNHPFDDEAGYRIRQQEYELPELRLEADEAAVLGLAARVWRRAELAGAAAGALLKLRAAGVETGDARQGIEPRLTAPEPSFGMLWEAVRDRRPVTFPYRAAGRSEAQQRTLEPWGVVNRRGRWYVAGWDPMRGATRVFRLSRIAGEVRFSGPARSVTVPDGVDVRELVRDWDPAPGTEQTAELRVRTGGGVGLRRGAYVRPGPDGWDLVTSRYRDVGWFADNLAWFGADVVVLEPPDLREAVIARLKGAL